MTRTFSCSLLLLVGALGCGGGQAGPREQAFVESADITNQSGGHVTVGLRVVLDDETEGSRAHLEAVIVDLDGRETTADLGEYNGDGEMRQVATGPAEVGHVQYDEGAIVHDLVLVESEDHERLQLRLDGEVVREIPLPEHEVVDPQSPFLLRPPMSE